MRFASESKLELYEFEHDVFLFMKSIFYKLTGLFKFQQKSCVFQIELGGHVYEYTAFVVARDILQLRPSYHHIVATNSLSDVLYKHPCVVFVQMVSHNIRASVSHLRLDHCRIKFLVNHPYFHSVIIKDDITLFDFVKDLFPNCNCVCIS